MTAAATLGVAGCSVFSPATVLKPYEPSDGSGTSLGDVQVRNVLLVSSGVDEPGVLSAVLVNSGDQSQDVDVSVDVDAGSAGSRTFSVPQGGSVHIGDPSGVAEGTSATDDDSGTESQDSWLQVPQVPVTPGQTVKVTFTVGGQEATVDAQVMLPCFEYATITPTAPAPTGTATETASATPSPSVTCGPAVGEDQTNQDESEG
ncbi:hypothetical protein CLV37_11465 [Kineococcus rhizosphaerae]|uniref:Copper(I)-binding protein n=1 Tax=Kineococcus rhizosphaerae TaxID=559628 RepID=A0A2T0QY39_9ACTN|nr:hypothetical protein CLV37_11465 [Kineococcus rhizosphaerae]